MRNNAGAITRARMLLLYFKEKGIEADYVNSNDVWGEVISKEHLEQIKSEGLIRRHYSLSKKPRLREFFKYLYYAVPRAVYRKILKVGTGNIPDYATNYSRSLFNKILRDNSYDYIIISYAYWANLVKNNPLVKQAKIVIDTHDFLTAQDQNRKGVSLKSAFADEINRLNLFDEVWVISTDEQYLFSQFCRNKVRLVPVSFDNNTSLPSSEKTFDLLYVGSDNPHNVRAAKWFFSEVYPRLPADVSVCAVGSIVRYVPDNPAITKIPFAEQLNDYYKKTRLAVCPMLSGTGVKIKVVEALSYGIPVVCSPKGVDGLINKSGNGCLIAENADEFIHLIRQLLADSKLYNWEQQRARDFFNEHHTHERFYNILDKVFIS